MDTEIVVSTIPATDTTGTMIRAKGMGHTIELPYDYAMSHVDNHIQARCQLIDTIHAISAYLKLNAQFSN